jgi:hypothetical protein
MGGLCSHKLSCSSATRSTKIFRPYKFDADVYKPELTRTTFFFFEEPSHSEARGKKQKKASVSLKSDPAICGGGTNFREIVNKDGMNLTRADFDNLLVTLFGVALSR